MDSDLLIFTGSPCGGTLSYPLLLTFNDTTGEWFYEDFKDCLWTLVAPEGSVIEFELYHIDIDCNRITDLEVSATRYETLCPRFPTRCHF